MHATRNATQKATGPIPLRSSGVFASLRFCVKEPAQPASDRELQNHTMKSRHSSDLPCAGSSLFAYSAYFAVKILCVLPSLHCNSPSCSQAATKFAGGEGLTEDMLTETLKTGKWRHFPFSCLQCFCQLSLFGCGFAALRSLRLNFIPQAKRSGNQYLWRCNPGELP